MKKSNARIAPLFMLLCLLISIFDSKSALQYTRKALYLCFMTVIPGIFPLLFLSSAIADEVKYIKLPFLERVLRIPQGASWLFLIGLLCGYPIGGKLLQEQINNGAMSKPAACRMMLFCNNAGPAFIIGILSSLFTGGAAITMWLIQITASIVLGIIIPATETNQSYQLSACNKSITQIMHDSIKTIGTICGWVIMFSVFIGYFDRITLNNLNPVLNSMIAGAAELTNGITRTTNIQSKSIAFTVSAILLSFGGICVILQTKSVTADLKIKPYLFARIIHAGISGTIASVAGIYLYPDETSQHRSIPLFLFATLLLIIVLHFNKKSNSISKKAVV